MVSGRSIMPRAETARPRLTKVGLALLGGLMFMASSMGAASCPDPRRAVYLTFDTGHMGVAPLIAEILSKHDVRVTFFAAHERTQTGDGSLGSAWADWWKARAAEGHAFATHTHDHAYWVADLPQSQAPQRFRIRPSAGPQQGQSLQWTAAQYCEELHRASRRLQQLTGQTPLPLFRAPGGKTSASLIQVAQSCGYQHVGWSAAGFLGDELPSESYPNSRLLEQALRQIGAGDVLVAHLGIWSRKDPWAPAVLEPLIVGLKRRGLCFATLRDHPQYRSWLDTHGGIVLSQRLQGGS